MSSQSTARLRLGPFVHVSTQTLVQKKPNKGLDWETADESESAFEPLNHLADHRSQPPLPPPPSVSCPFVMLFTSCHFQLPFPPQKTGLEFTPIANEEQSQGQMKQIINLGSHF